MGFVSHQEKNQKVFFLRLEKITLSTMNILNGLKLLLFKNACQMKLEE